MVYARRSTLSDRNTGASLNLADLTFYSWRAGLVGWLQPKVVLDIYNTDVEMLSCWVVGLMWNFKKKKKKKGEAFLLEHSHYLQQLQIQKKHSL